MGQPIDFVGLNTFIYEPLGWDTTTQTNLAGGSGSVEKIKNNNVPNLGDYDVPVEQNTFGNLGTMEIEYGQISPAVHNSTFRLTNVKYQLLGGVLPDPATGNKPNDAIGATRAKAQHLNILTLRRNGPYGYSTWKQIRVSQNPLTRKQNKNNIFTYVIQGDEVTSTLSGSVAIKKNRYSTIQKKVETPVASKFKPIEVLLGVTDEDIDRIRRVMVRSPLGNDVVFFNNKEVDQHMDVEYEESEAYKTIKGMYLAGALDSPDSPIDSFEYIKYSETIFPSLINVYQNYSRSRTNFQFSWRSSNEKRVKPSIAFTGSVYHDGAYVQGSTPQTAPSIDYGFGFNVPYQSDWVLDSLWNLTSFAPPQDGLFLTRTGALGLTQYDQYNRYMPTRASISSASVYYYPIGGAAQYWNGDTAYNYRTGSLSSSAGGEGQLMNSYCMFTDWRQVTSSGGSHPAIDDFLTASSLYSRKTLIPTRKSLAAQSGRVYSHHGQNTDDLLHMYHYFGGATAWTAGDTRKSQVDGVLVSNKRYPMDDNYDKFAEYTKILAKDYSIVPEFKISNHVEFYDKFGPQEENKALFGISGSGKYSSNQGEYNSSDEEFYKIYSNTDFMKHFDLVKNDHSEFVEPSAISLKCNAIKKLLPYDGFYPAQRANQLAKQFYKSYGDHFDLNEASVTISDTPGTLDKTQTTELVFMPNRFNAIFEDSTQQPHYGNKVNNNNSTFHELHGEYPQISHDYLSWHSDEDKPNYAPNDGYESGYGVKWLFDRIHQGQMDYHMEGAINPIGQGIMALEFNGWTSWIPAEGSTDIKKAKFNVYRAHKLKGHFPALRKWKYWIGINAVNGSNDYQNVNIYGDQRKGWKNGITYASPVDQQFHDAHDGNPIRDPETTLSPTTGLPFKMDINFPRKNNLVHQFSGEVCEYGSVEYNTNNKVGFEYLNLIPDEFFASYHKLRAQWRVNTNTLSRGWQFGFDATDRFNTRIPDPSERSANCPKSVTNTFTSLTTSPQGYKFGPANHHGPAATPTTKFNLPKFNEQLYPTSYKTQYPMTMVSDGYGNYVAFLFIRDDNDQTQTVKKWQGFGGNNMHYDDPTVGGSSREQRNYFIPVFRDKSHNQFLGGNDPDEFLPSRIRTTPWGVSVFTDENLTGYGKVPKATDTLGWHADSAVAESSDDIYWGINMGKPVFLQNSFVQLVGRKQKAWEKVYEDNPGTQPYHPDSDFITEVNKPDLNANLGDGLQHTFTSLGNVGRADLGTPAKHSNTMKQGVFHPLKPPIVVIRVPKRNGDRAQFGSTTEWSSYYAAKYMAEAINDIKNYWTDPTGKYKHISPLYKAFSDSGIIPNNGIISATPYTSQEPSWYNNGSNQKWDVSATFSQDSDSPAQPITPPGIPHPFSRLVITRKPPTGIADYDDRYWRYIINWNTGIGISRRSSVNQYETTEEVGRSISDTNPNYTLTTFDLLEMDDFRENRLGTSGSPMVAHGSYTYHSTNLSWSDLSDGSINLNALSSPSANADSKYCKIQPMLTPMFAPGVLFNTIKSGVACDYPLMTDRINRVLAAVTGSEGAVSFWMIGSRSIATSSFVGTTDYFASTQGDLVQKPDVNNQNLPISAEIDDSFFQTASANFDLAKTIFDTLPLKRNSTTGNFRGFDLRIPFEALVEPENYLANRRMINQEPDNFLYFDKHLRLNYETRWDGQGDQIYKKMAHNFLAEVPEFFLLDGNFKSIRSLEQGNANFGNVDGFYAQASATSRTPYCYKMRVKMYKSLDKTANTIWSNGTRVKPPQVYLPDNPPVNPRETITMYSRPSAFGPPSWDGDFRAEWVGSLQTITGSDNRFGYNFPFTPPYYHGEAWADITFKPDKIRKYTLSEIIASSSVEYYRYWHPNANTSIEARQADSGIHFAQWTGSLLNKTSTNDNFYAPQHPLFVNDNAMQLEASLNLFGRTLEDPVQSKPQSSMANILRPNIIVDTIEQNKARWVIQPKFETPILNFTTVLSQSQHITGIEIDSTLVNTNPLQITQGSKRVINIYDGGLHHTIFYDFGSVLDVPDPSVSANLIRVSVGLFGNAETVRDQTILAINASSSLQASPLGQTGMVITSSAGGIMPNASIDASASPTFASKFTITTLQTGSIHTDAPVAHHSPAATTVGMWHQYGVVPTGSQGIFMQIEDVPKTWMKGALGIHTARSQQTASLADLVGFPKTSQRLGELANTKKVYEAVVAIPFIEESNERKFFEIPRRDIDNALDPSPEVRTVGNSIRSMVDKMGRYVFPPSMDFLRNRDITPFAMYIFEFSHVFTKQDLTDIWQNIAPKIGVAHQAATATITHELLSSELIGGGSSAEDPTREAKKNRDKGIPFPDKIRWMVFKVKQRAKTNYYDKVIQKRGIKEEEEARELTRVSFNWPYDYFSLVELVKLDASVVLAEIEDPPVSPNDDSNRSIMPKITRLNTPRSLMKSMAKITPNDTKERSEILKAMKSAVSGGFKFNFVKDDD